ncbi:hypothetical protein [uncultured Eudoraea sp.]|uniref:hypothetical protein n=1 Tax=uncultured Eudoraea sp. TaxID=1035614 RepID=UPI00263A06E3|nr:hypothetical protein [uncultured Eudoraea sp.]
MKSNNLFYTLMVFALLFISCSSDNSDDVNAANIMADIQEISDLVSTGTWTITNFIDSGSDETTNFTGYGFSFNSDGNLVADNGSITIDGTWSVTDDSSNDDSNDDSSNDDSSDDIDFNIFFASPSNFNELSEDWDIVSRTNSRIELIHISGGNGGTDTLTFEQN